MIVGMVFPHNYLLMLEVNNGNINNLFYNSGMQKNISVNGKHVKGGSRWATTAEDRTVRVCTMCWVERAIKDEQPLHLNQLCDNMNQNL